MVLAKNLPPTHRVILVERNTHFNHLYVFPRFIVYPGHEHKAFVPYTSIFSESPARMQPGMTDHTRLHALKSHSKTQDAPLDATGMEEAIIEENSSGAGNARKENQFVEVSDMIKDKLHVEAKPLSETHVNGTVKPTNPFENSEPHMTVCGQVLSISSTHVSVRQHVDTNDNVQDSHKLWPIDTVNIPYSHMIYALGSHMPDPLRHESYSKDKGIQWMKKAHQRIETSKEIILIGGGALGVELATDIKTLYKDKKVTLIHSRKQLLPNFDQRIHERALAQLKALGVNVILGHRLALAEGCPMGSSVQHFDQKKATEDRVTAPSDKPKPTIIEPEVPEGEEPPPMRHRIRTTLGLELECDLLLLCTGQQPNSSIMANFSPGSVNHKSRLIRVMRTLQVMVSNDENSLQQPFVALPPCKDCDCFLDYKAAGANAKHEHENELDLDARYFPNIYAIGDVADAFGALNAGYQAWFMGETAAANILRDITHRTDPGDPSTHVPDGQPIPLQEFNPGPDMIKLTIGGGKVVTQGAPEPDKSLPGHPERPTITESDDTEDMYVDAVWKSMALADPSDMYR